MPCRFLFLGSPQFLVEGNLVQLNLRKAIGLVSYLVVEQRSFSREYLSTLLWPESGLTEGLAALRRTLSIVRRELGTGTVVGDGSHLSVGQVSADVHDFKRLVESESLDDHVLAAGLYRGSFLEGFNIGTCEEFDLWQDTTRQGFQWEFEQLLETLCIGYMDRHEPEHAIPVAQRWIVLDSWNETAHRILMEAFARAGNRRAALEQFQSCKRLLDREGVDLDAKTTELHRLIADNRLAPVAAASGHRPPTSRRAAVPDLVGRAREMRILQDALEDAREHRGRLVVISGEAGIGKTALASEFLRSIPEAPVLASRLREGFEVPPYWPWIQILVELRRLSGRPIPPGAADAQIHTLLELESEASQLELFDAVCHILLRERDELSIILLDSFHLSDPASIDLLAYVAAEIASNPILVLLTVRDLTADTNRNRLASLAGLQCFRHVGLSGLTPEESSEVLRSRLGQRCTREIEHRVYEQTLGHPLFLVESVRLMSDSSVSDPVLAIPSRLNLVVVARLDALPASCRQTLEVAAVCGDDTQLDLVTVVAGQSGPRATRHSLQSAFSSGILAEYQPGTLRFRHALIREIVYNLIPAHHREILHERVGDALLARDDSEARMDLITEHFFRAGTATALAKHRRCAKTAGKLALREQAFDTAAAHFRRASAGPGTEIRDQVDAEICAGLTRAHYELSRLYLEVEALRISENLTRVADYYISTGNRHGLARFVLATEEIWFHETDPETQRRILYALPESTTLALSTFPIQHDEKLMRRAIRFHRASVRKARRRRDVRHQARSLLKLTRIEVFSNRFSSAWKHFQKLRAIHRPGSGVSAAYDHRTGSSTFDFTVWYPASRGRLDDAAESSDAFLRYSERLGWSRSVVRALLTGAMLRRARGQFAEAEAYLSRAAEAAPDDPQLKMIRALLEFDHGDFEEASGLALRYSESASTARSYPTALYAIAVLARMYRMTGRAHFKQAAQAIGEEMGQMGPQELLHDAATVGYALIAATDGDHEACRSFHRILRRCPRKMAGGLLISSDRLLALLADSAGWPLRSRMHFARALRFTRDRFRPEEAWIAHDYAVALSRRRSPPRRRIDRLLRHSASLASQLDMKTLSSRVGGLVEPTKDSR